MANSLAMNAVNNIFNQRLTARLKAIATGKGDEVPEVLSLEAAAAEQTEVEQPATDLEAGTEQLPSESEAALESVESSAPMNESEAEQEQSAGEEDVMAQEPPQGDKETGESEA